MFVPVSRDELGKALVDGLGDVAFASIVVTPERQKLVDFTTPTNTGVSEVVVTGPKSPKIATLDDLSGQEVYVREKSIYHEGLVRVNEDFKKRGKAPVAFKFGSRQPRGRGPARDAQRGAGQDGRRVQPLANVLETGPSQPRAATTRPWSPRTSISRAAIRKNSPKLKAELDGFIKTHGRGNHVRQHSLREVREEFEVT